MSGTGHRPGPEVGPGPDAAVGVGSGPGPELGVAPGIASRLSRFSRRAREDRGSASAETAIVLPVVLVLVMLLAVVGTGIGVQVRLESAARAAARELARGEDEAGAVAAAQRVGGPGTRVSIREDGAWVEVRVERVLRPAARGPLSGMALTLSGSAQARREPALVPAGAGAGP